MASLTSSCGLPMLISIMLLHSGISSDDAGCLPTETVDEAEAQALRDAAKEVGKPVWRCMDNPCTKGNPETCWYTKMDPANPTFVNQVTCECLDHQWHVVNISWKGQNLGGSVPRSLAKLPYIETIDLYANLLSGLIPEEWASMNHLEYLSLAVNKLSGSIPRFLGNITSFQSNQFTGIVPRELGKLIKLKTLDLRDNNLTGQLPEDLKNLSNLMTLWLSSNNFNGRVPDFIGNWRNLTYLGIQGSGFEGPIPNSISLLSNLKVLMISDLGGEGSEFPQLPDFTNFSTLVLRNCNISGNIPHNLTRTQWKILDLSFNKLDGCIPNGRIQTQQLYLSHNRLTGAIPSWVNQVDSSFRIADLSYNLFNESSDFSMCPRADNPNLYRSFLDDRNMRSNLCLTGVCPKDHYAMHINCGGEKIQVKGITYEKDVEPGAPAKFFHGESLWGFSSSGNYVDSEENSGYIATDNSTLSSKDSKLNDSSFSSLGRRKFDIYIQDKLVCKDFDIVANGSYAPVKLVFTNIQVNGTIEIRLYYAGKGSTGIPKRVKGSYGPLISAISVDPDYRTPFDKKREIWISIGATSLLLCLFIVTLAAFQLKKRCQGMISREIELQGLHLQTGSFTFRQIRAATNNFDPACKIGEGGFGSVYMGTLLDGTSIAVKQLSSRSWQGNREFVNEVGIISGLHHPNLVRLDGCCVEGSQLFLIYEYMENNNLALALFDQGEGNGQSGLDWHTRLRICISVARGLTYLHEESAMKIVHRDIKATNILLDRDLNAKISDFGLARLHEEQNTHISTRIAGTIGYMAPEYALWGHLTYKADVYSFGIVLLEIVAGRSNVKQPDERHFCLLDKAFVLHQQKQNIIELVDPRLGVEYNEEEALRMLKVALLCTNPSPALRPTMSAVLSMLEGTLIVPESNLDPNIHDNKWLHQALRIKHDQMAERETQSLILSSNAPTNEASSSSYRDLYPINPYSR